MRLDPRKTGAYISRLRREKDWTQLALAEKLHIELGFEAGNRLRHCRR